MAELQKTLLSFETETPKISEPSALDPRALSSVLVSLKMGPYSSEEGVSASDPQKKLLDCIHSPAIGALLDAAQRFAQERAIPSEEALRQIVLSLQEADRLWSQVLVREGMQRLSSQYH
jgi:hypothetical protein